LYIQTVPTGGLLSGSSSLVRTKAWNWEDAVLVADDGIHLRWPTLRGLSPRALEQRNEQITHLLEFLAQTVAYLQNNTPQAPNMRMEAMRSVFGAKKNLYVHADAANDILDAMQFLAPYKHLKIVWMGASQAHLIVDELKDFGKPVVLDITHRLPSANHEDIDLPYKLPAILWKSGVKVALAHSGSWEARNLMFNAGTAAAYGLTREEALQLITQHPAEIMGAADVIGTIAVGKQASIIISTGDLLDMKSSHITKAFLDGEQIEVSGEQQLLYQKYMKKYGFTEPERK
jgi:imidazolonepropionase-like amidohydrolase